MRSIPGIRLSLLALVCAGLAACSGDSPEAAYKGFYYALAQGKLDEAQGYLTNSVNQMYGGKVRMGLANAAQQIQKCGGIKDVLVELKGEGDIRSGKGMVLFKGDCPQETSDVMLIREDRKWKISMGR